MAQTLALMAVGPGVDPEGLSPLSAELSRRFTVQSRIAPQVMDTAFAYDPARNQYHSTRILTRLAGINGTGRVLGVAAVDLFVPILTFVFGEAQLEGNAAVISWHRLRERYYGLPARGELESDRILKEAVHELGHTYGLRHCSDWRCVMSSSHDVGRIDVKSADFCAVCLKAIGSH
jgi:archaemetzincin